MFSYYWASVHTFDNKEGLHQHLQLTSTTRPHQHFSKRGFTIILTYYSDLFASIDTFGINAHADYIDFTLVDVSCFGFVRSTYVASPANAGQEWLWRGHGGLAPPVREVLPVTHKQRPKGVVGFIRTNATLSLLRLL